jgi:hypothetical protein
MQLSSLLMHEPPPDNCGGQVSNASALLRCSLGSHIVLRRSQVSGSVAWLNGIDVPGRCTKYSRTVCLIFNNISCRDVRTLANTHARR